VQSASITSALPLSGADASGGFVVEGRPEPPPANQPVAKLRTVGSEYFRTLGIPLQRGRLFTDQDRADGPGVVIINESMANRFWPNEDPLGKRIKLAAPDSPWAEIVGVVKDVRHSGLTARPSPELYQPFSQNPQAAMVLAVRTSSNPEGLTPAVRSQIFGLDRDQPVSNVRTMEKIISDSVYLSRFAMILLDIFAAVALILAAVGIYSVMSYSVTQRSHEIGIRMALGAKPRAILRMVVGNGLTLALVGLGLGLVAAFGVTRLMRSLLFGVSVSDPVSFGAVTLLMALVAVVASYIPARRATRVNPASALREE
jgi:putative ABC transport system permease protein